VRLEILDRATHETLERLIAAGLVAPTSRAARPLHPAAETPPPLNPAEQARVTAHRELAARKLRMAVLLAGGGLLEEARPPLLDAVAALARVRALEARLPEPANLAEALQPPLVALLGAHAQAIRTLVEQPAADFAPALEAVAALQAKS
jgi:hypothetical protein